MFEKLRLSVPRKLFLTYVLLVTPNFVAFYLFRGYLLFELLTASQTSDEWIFLGEITYTLSVILFALLEVFLIKIINKKKLLTIYVFFSIFVNSLFFMFSKGPIVLLICDLSGGAYGLGFPLIHSLIIDNTPIEKRCRLLGFIIFISIIVFLTSFIVSTLFSFTLTQFFILILLLQLSSILSLNNIDLFIAIDSVTIHLAGVMKIPSWLMLGYGSDWRWGRKYTKSIWYDNVELIRMNENKPFEAIMPIVKKKLKTQMNANSN